VEHSSAHGPDPLQLTADLVGIDSHNPGPGEAAISDFVVEHVAIPLGAEVTRFEPVPGRPNVMLTIDRGPGPHLVLSGHLDTKPVGDAGPLWNTDPLTLVVDDGLAYGLGASDMKGPIASMLTALHRFAGRDGPGKASVLLTADEEVASAAGAAALAAAGQPRCDALVIGEPSGADRPWEMIALVSRGICCVEIELTTTQGHSGLSELRGPNAVVVAADVVRAFHEFSPPVAVPGPINCAPTVNAGVTVSGGVGFGTSPGRCVVGCEIRLVPGMDQAEVEAAIRTLVHDAVAGRAEVAIRFLDDGRGWAAATVVAPDEQVVVSARRACREVLGAEPPLDAYPGTTEASHFIPALGIPVIASLGPGWLSVAHGPNECVGVDQLYEAASIYHLLLEDFCAAAEPTTSSTNHR